MEVTYRIELLTIHRYFPSLAFATAAMLKVAELAPMAISTPSFCHWYMRLSPVAVTVKVADCPGITNARETGCSVITGGSTAEEGRDGGRKEGKEQLMNRES